MHCVLAKAAREYGGQAALAEFLGVHPTTLGRWIHRDEVPPIARGSTRKPDLAARLLVATGLSVGELWPTDVCLAWDERVIAERHGQWIATILSHGHRLQLQATIAESLERLVVPDPAEVVAELDWAAARHRAIDKALRELSYREREIVRHHFGLGRAVMTTAELAALMRVGTNRIWQIYHKALRKLRLPEFAAILEWFC